MAARTACPSRRAEDAKGARRRLRIHAKRLGIDEARVIGAAGPAGRFINFAVVRQGDSFVASPGLRWHRQDRKKLRRPRTRRNHGRGRRMVDLTYRMAPGRTAKRESMSAARAQRKLERGNGVFSGLIAAMRAGKSLDHVTRIAAEDLGSGDTECAVQAPYAAILSCSDARVPTEMVFQQGFNDLFVVRVAGNVLGSECLGSLRYATSHFPDSLKLAAVVGHANCGAVTAAVDAFLHPGRYLGTAGNYPLRTIIDQIMVSARSADKGLREVHGPTVVDHPDYRKALVGVSVAVNAAWNAFSLREELVGHSAADVMVVFGVYDLGSHRMGLIPTAGARPLRNGFLEAPADATAFRALVEELCQAALAPEQPES